MDSAICSKKARAPSRQDKAFQTESLFLFTVEKPSPEDLWNICAERPGVTGATDSAQSPLIESPGQTEDDCPVKLRALSPNADTRPIAAGRRENSLVWKPLAAAHHASK